jgi:ribonuclease HI
MRKRSKIDIWTDGAIRRRRGDPNPYAAIAFVIKDKNGKVIYSHQEIIQHCERSLKSNEVEIFAVIRALEYAREFCYGTVRIHTDDEVIARKRNNKRKPKEWKFKYIEDLEKHFREVLYFHENRENNELADKLCKEALDKFYSNKNFK